MGVQEARVQFAGDELAVELPLTQPTGKVRIKERSFFGEYGRPVAVRQTKLGLSNYVEWQIGYDLEANPENLQRTSLKDRTFVNYKGVVKYAYELSEILYYAFRRKLVSAEEIELAYRQIESVSDSRTFEVMEEMNISRTNPKETVINGIGFYKMTVQYPMLVRKFGQYDIYAEIVVREKQRAVGTQAMLFVCLPITSLRFKQNALGRILEAKESACWPIGREEASLALELFRIFGMLSPKHKCDVLAILRMLFGIKCA